eukprot:Gb_15615 [translate_table: standard]
MFNQSTNTARRTAFSCQRHHRHHREEVGLQLLEVLPLTGVVLPCQFEPPEEQEQVTQQNEDLDP